MFEQFKGIKKPHEGYEVIKKYPRPSKNKKKEFKYWIKTKIVIMKRLVLKSYSSDTC